MKTKRKQLKSSSSFFPLLPWAAHITQNWKFILEIGMRQYVIFTVRRYHNQQTSLKRGCQKSWASPLFHSVVPVRSRILKKFRRRALVTQRCISFLSAMSLHSTPPIAEILCVKNGRAIVVCGFLIKWLKNIYWKFEKNHGSCLGLAW